jgi:hypothetical protein
MPTKKKKKTTRRPAKRTAAKRNTTARRAPSPAQKAARARFAARFGGRKPAASEAKRHTKKSRPKKRRVHETPAVAEAKRRTKKRRVRETSVVTEAKRRTKKRKPAARRTKKKKSAARRKPASYVMAKHRRPKKSAHRRPKKRKSAAHRKVRAWHGDSAGHSKAAKKGWKGRKGHKSGKTTKRATESRRRPKHRRVRETMTVQARRRPKHRRVRETMTVQSRRRPKKHRAREATRVGEARRRSYKRRVVRAPSFSSIKRSALDMGLELGAGVAGYLFADAVDRFLAGYDPAAANKPANKFTSDGAGTIANALNIASAPDLWRYGSLAALTLLPLGGSLFAKHPTLRSSAEGIGIGAGIKLFSTIWSNVLMPMLIGKDTSVPALQKSWVARLYPAEVSAALNMKSGTAAVSSAGKAGTLSGGSEQRDAGPFALAGRFDRFGGGGRRDWVAPSPWQQTSVPDAPYDQGSVDPLLAPPGGQVAPPAAPAWPAHFGERHRWGLRGVGEAVEDMTHTIAAQTGVHPAHAVNAAMHAAAEPHDLTQALERALPHVNRTVLHETARHLHPHVARMHAHARHPREHGEWMNARASEGFPAPEHDAPESEWSDWHSKRADAGLPQAPHPPEPPHETPAHLRSQREWHPSYNRKIVSDRYATVPQVLGIGAGGPASSGYPGQPGLGEAFSDAVQTVAATVPGMPLENAVNATAFAAAEPCDLVRAFERAMPQIRRALAQECASAAGPHINRIIEQTGVPLPTDAGAPAPLPPVPSASELPAIEFAPSPPPPSWSRSAAEWHEQEKHDWENAHSGAAHPAAVVAAATHAAEAAAAPHADANHPAVAAAVHAVADGAAQAASAAPPGTPPHVVAQAAKEGAKAAAAAHGAAADHPAVKAAVAAAAPAAANAAATPATGTAGVGHPPRNLPVGPPKLPHPGPQPVESECGCLDDSPYLGFVGDEVEEDLMFNIN